MELLGLFVGYGSAVAGADGIDEHQIGDVEDGVLVGDETARRGHPEPVFVHEDPLRAECTQMQPNR